MPVDSINAENSLNIHPAKSAGSDHTAIGGEDFPSILHSVASNMNSSDDLNGIFKTASEKYQVPVNLLKAVAKAESNYNPTAQSGCGAQGIMQLMPATAKSLGVSDPFDPEQNIMGGAKLLSQLLNRFDGNTQFALAAYNAGPGNVLKYEGIPPFAETQNYVKKVLAYCADDYAAVPASNSADISSAIDTWMSLKDLKPQTTNDDIQKQIADSIFMNVYEWRRGLLSDLDLNEDRNKKEV